MSRLKLESLHIKNYRSLRDVSVKQLGRLNLVTGRNNIGKTSLLEVVRLWASQTEIGALLGIIDSRDESAMPEKRVSPDRLDGRSLEGCQYLFYGYPSLDSISESIEVSNGICRLRISVQGNRDRIESSSVSVSNVDELFKGQQSLELRTDMPDRAYRISLPSYYGADSYDLVTRRGIEQGAVVYPCVYLSSMYVNGAAAFDAATLWDNVALTRKEESVLLGLRIIEEDIRGVSFIHSADKKGRIPVVRLAGTERPIPLRGLGDGVMRLFQMVLALANSEGGFLLIDEFENGLHYSIQETAWVTILKMANEFNVQVFATTHSSDCVDAFQRVSEAASDDTMALIRLTRDDDGVRAETLNSEKLSRRLELGREVR